MTERNPVPGGEQGADGPRRPSSVEPLPLRLHRAVSLLSRLDHPEAAAVQGTLGEVAARIVVLEEALRALLDGKPGAAEKARAVLAGG